MPLVVGLQTEKTDSGIYDTSPIPRPNPTNDRIRLRSRHYLQSALLLQPVLGLAFATHQVARKGEESGVDGCPGENDAVVETEAGMEVEEELVGGFEDYGLGARRQ